MTKFVCKRCHKDFYDKINYKKHKNRKFKCEEKPASTEKKPEIKCEHCGQKFSRPFTLKRHLENICNVNNVTTNIITDNTNQKNEEQKNKAHLNDAGIMAGNDNNNTVDNSKNDITNNINTTNNIIINNNNYITPFGKEKLNILSMEDKIEIFVSESNPMEMLIVKINFDPKHPENHNVGYTDTHSAYGIYYNGKKWRKERINCVLDKLFEYGEAKLYSIHQEIDEFLEEPLKTEIPMTLKKISKTLNSQDVNDVRDKNNMKSYFKATMHDKKELVIDAQIHTPNCIDENLQEIKQDFSNTKYPPMSKLEISNMVKRKNNILLQRKCMAYDLLEEIKYVQANEQQYILIKDIIRNNTDIEIIKIINKTLLQAYCKRTQVNTDVITNAIEKEKEIQEFIKTLQ